MRKRFGALLVAATLLISLFTISVPANQAFASTKAKVTATTLNIREKPTTASKVIGKYKKGQTVTITQQQNGWSKVPVGSKTGWISSKYVTVIKPTATKAAVSGTKYYVTATTLNIRKSPSTSAARVDLVKKNAGVTLYEKKGSWGRVKTASGKTGWAHLSYLTTKAPASPKPAAKPAATAPAKYYVTATSLNIRKSPSTTAAKVDLVKKNAAVSLYEKKGSWGKVKTASGKTGWASLSYLTTKAPAAPKPAPKPAVTAPAKYYVTATSLNIRKSPSTTAAKVDLVKKNAAVSLYEKKGSWGKVKTASGKTGWASLSYLTTKAPAAPKPAPKPPVTNTSGKSYVVIRTDGVNIRKSASASAAIVTKVNRGTKLEKISVDNGWVQVKTSSGQTGWVANWLATTAGIGVRGKVIVLDPGHGGTDPGAVGKGGTKEKTINLSTANEIKTLLQNAGAKVIMTRTTDKTLTLDQRVAISNQYKPDVFISIHYNAGSSAADGIETYYDKTYGNEAELASSIQKELIKQTGLDSRGTKTAGFQVVKYSESPAVLLELGFLSNPAEEAIIKTKSFQQKAARGVFNGLNNYFNL